MLNKKFIVAAAVGVFVFFGIFTYALNNNGDATDNTSTETQETNDNSNDEQTNNSDNEQINEEVDLVPQNNQLVPLIADTIDPVIVINGETENFIELGEEYTDLGATVTDNLDNDITVVTTGTVNNRIAGVYQLTYNATDDAGNVATATRTVSVRPVISGITEYTYEIGDSFTAPELDLVTNLDSPAVSLAADNVADIDATTVDTYELKYNYTTEDGVSALEKTLVLNVVDTTAPTVSVLPEEGNITLTGGETFKLTIDAFDAGVLSELEVDHNLNGFPEFSVYADETNPYGSLLDEILFNGAGVDVTYDATAQKWEIDFGNIITNALMSQGNVDFYIVVKDEAGNQFGTMDVKTADNTLTYNVIDTKEPEFTVTGNPDYLVNNDVTLTVDASDNKTEVGNLQYSFDGGTTWSSEYTKTYTDNTLVVVKVKDEAGNISEQTIDINKIDRNVIEVTKVLNNGSVKPIRDVKPRITVSAKEQLVESTGIRYVWTTSSEQPTDEQFTETVNPSYNSSANLYVNYLQEICDFISNPTGTYYLWIKLEDKAGNKLYFKTESFNIDNINPEFTVTGNPTHLVNTDVTLTVNALDNKTEVGNLQYSFDGGITWSSDYTKTYTNNTTVVVKVKDEAGNISEQTIDINKIDRNVIEVTKVLNNGSVKPIRDVKPRITVSAKEQLAENTGIRYVWTTSNEQPTDEQFTEAVNPSYNSNANLYVNYLQEICDFISNPTGTYYLWIKLEDKVGNKLYFKTESFNIDNINPEFTVTGNPDYLVNNDVTLTVDASDNKTEVGNLQYSFDGGTTWSSEYTKTYTDNTLVVVKVKDEAGNISEQTIDINKIDRNVIEVTKVLNNGSVKPIRDVKPRITVSAKEQLVENTGIRYVWTISSEQPTDDQFTETVNPSYNSSANLYVNYLQEISDFISNPTGTYYLWIKLEDKVGNKLYFRSESFNMDNVKPIITLSGDAEQTIEAGEIYVDEGAIANDNKDGDITNSIVVNNPVNTNIVGDYTITYNVTDLAGNTAAEVIRTIHVVDTTSPIVRAQGNRNPIIEAGVDYVDEGAVITDNAAGATLTDTIVYYYEPAEGFSSTNRVKKSTYTVLDIDPSDIDTSIVGFYRIVYKGVDGAGFTASDNRNMWIVDTTSPIVRAQGNRNPIIEAGVDYVDEGAVITDNAAGATLTDTIVYYYEPAEGFSSTNRVKKSTYTVLGIDPSDIDTSIVGFYRIVYKGVDGAGFTASDNRNMWIVDSVAPTINSVVANITEWTNESVTLTIDASDNGVGLHDDAYSFDNGSTWQTQATKEFSDNRTVNIKVRDYLGNSSTTTYTISNIVVAGLTFDDDVELSSVQEDDTWYIDRYAPNGFETVNFDGSNRLQQTISSAEGALNRPANYSSSFYNTQGRKYDTPNATELSVDLYIPSEWATTNRRMAGLWAVDLNSHGTLANYYPILEFTSTDLTPRFQIWPKDGTGGDFQDIGLPSDFQYDNWYTLKIKLDDENDTITYSVGDNFSYQINDVTDVTSLGSIILQGYNTTNGVDYNIYWDNFVAKE